MTKLQLGLDAWERKLKREGLAPIERTYRTITEDGVHQFTKIEAIRRSQEFHDYFSRCGEFAEELRCRLRIWSLYSRGETFRDIARKTHKPFGTVQSHIKSLRRAMVLYFARTSDKPVPLAPEAELAGDIVEIFVEAQQTPRRNNAERSRD